MAISIRGSTPSTGEEASKHVDALGPDGAPAQHVVEVQEARLVAHTEHRRAVPDRERRVGPGPEVRRAVAAGADRAVDAHERLGDVDAGAREVGRLQALRALSARCVSTCAESVNSTTTIVRSVIVEQHDEERDARLVRRGRGAASRSAPGVSRRPACVVAAGVGAAAATRSGPERQVDGGREVVDSPGRVVEREVDADRARAGGRSAPRSPNLDPLGAVRRTRRRGSRRRRRRRWRGRRRGRAVRSSGASRRSRRCGVVPSGGTGVGPKAAK
jgi:hypothetical protein